MTIHYNGDPGATLDRINQLDLAEYNEIYRPINREMINSTNSTSLVDAAKTYANSDFESGKARESRMLERFGLNYNALEASEGNRRSAAAKSLNYDDVVNRSRLKQYDRNVGVRNEMIAVGRGIDRSAHAQLSTAAGLQSQREAQNSLNGAASGSAKYMNMASGASAGMMGAYAMGMGAGPIGWAALGGAALFSLF